MTPDNPSLWLILLGAVAGGVGTLIGAGGGFLLVPALIFLYPAAAPDTITSISLAVVACNAISGSIAYAHMKRIDYPLGWRLALAAAPASVLGALSTSLLPRRMFDTAFGVVLLVAGTAMLTWPKAPEGVGEKRRTALGMTFSAGAAYVSSLFGIGGGGLHVPVLVYVLGVPAHIATATATFILAGMALIATATHLVTGSLAGALWPTLYLAAGALVGAQAGAAFSNRVHGTTLIRGLAVALGVVGVRILLRAL
ncbi:MAG: sulfite exporter TauE/SafE family protein [Gemmatimonadetes bacterium]|nr:sulfite exporter TauE/SafE family protein [Gemmatimonadota bacterium]